VDLTLNLERAQGGEGDLALDGRLALAYGAVVKEFERLTGVPVQVGLSDLLKVKDLVRAPEPPAGETFFAAMAEEATRAAMAGLRDMRRREGEALLVDIKRRLLQCGGMVGEIGKHAVDIKAAQYRRLKDNLAELEGKVAVAEDRLAQEVALYAERCDITEELTRFRAHLDHIDEMFADEEVGKRADFLLQELFREINTIASKANMAEIRHIVVEVKGELEKVREQVQNLE
jgi:uncharacterized protein (TIGR00255 family)